MSESAPRVLIVRLSAIGDAVLTLPLLCALREVLPASAHLAWAAHPAAAQVLRGHADLDELIVVPKRVYAGPRRLGEVALELRRRRFDVVLDPQSLTKSALLGWFSEAPRRVCFGGRGHELAPWLATELVMPRTSHLTDRTLELLAPLGLERPATVRFRLPRDEAADSRMRDAVAQLGVEAGGFALCNPGATWPSKRWPPARFGEVAARLAAEQGPPTLILWGSPEERAWADEACAASGSKHVQLAPPTTLRELVALCRLARLMVSADSGPLHIAVAAGTPCVGLYGPTRPADCGPYGRPHIALQARYQAGSRRERRRATNDAMCEITVADVVAACNGLL